MLKISTALKKNTNISLKTIDKKYVIHLQLTQSQ